MLSKKSLESSIPEFGLYKMIGILFLAAIGEILTASARPLVPFTTATFSTSTILDSL